MDLYMIQKRVLYFPIFTHLKCYLAITVQGLACSQDSDTDSDRLVLKKVLFLSAYSLMTSFRLFNYLVVLGNLEFQKYSHDFFNAVQSSLLLWDDFNFHFFSSPL